MSLAGQPLGGWGQYSLSPTMSAWSAHLFYLHWRYTRTTTFPARACLSVVLRCRSSACSVCSSRGADRTLVLPLSSSPEIFDNSPQAWLEPNSNYDLMCLKMLFLSLQEMADACGKPDEVEQWAKAAAGLGDYHSDATVCC